MAEPGGRPSTRYVGMATTAIAASAAAAAVGWAAAVPVLKPAPAAAPAPAPANSTSVRTSRLIEAATANLRQVRRDLALLLSSEDKLPRAKLANLPAAITRLPTVSAPPTLRYQPPPAAVPAAPPATHTTTGASGVRP